MEDKRELVEKIVELLNKLIDKIVKEFDKSLTKEEYITEIKYEKDRVKLELGIYDYELLEEIGIELELDVLYRENSKEVVWVEEVRDVVSGEIREYEITEVDEVVESYIEEAWIEIKYDELEVTYKTLIKKGLEFV